MSVTGSTGETIVYRDRKRYLWWLSLIPPLVPLLSFAVYFWTGNAAATLGPLLFIFVVIPLLDALIGEDPHNPPEEVVGAMDADPYYMRLVRAAVPLMWLSFISTAAFIGTQNLPLWSYVALVLGVSSIDAQTLVAGHELGHKTDRLNKVFGILAINVVGYAHFRIEHNRGHHTWVATPDDPASARFGESVYAFAARELPGAFKQGWRYEAERLARSGKSVWSMKNEILLGFALTLAVAGGLIVLFGWKVAPFIFAHHFIAWFQLSQINYVEHYGLLRQKGPNGRYQPVEPRHSWNTNHMVSNLLLFQLQRHSDHHANPMRSYQALRNFDDLPRLPSGYPAMLILSAIPPLWFRVMNPKAMAWAGGDITKLHVANGSAGMSPVSQTPS